MAELDFSRVRLLSGFNPRRIIIPTSVVTVDEHCIRSFELQTTKGTIKVHAFSHGWDCDGRIDAFLDYGLISEDWLPGAPGNNKTSQIVLLMPDGRAALGTWQGGAPKGFPSIRLQRISAVGLNVRMSYSEPEQAEYDNFCELQKQKEAEKEALEAWNKAKKAHDPEEDFPNRWRSAVNRKLKEVAQLIDGSRVFTDFPELRLTGQELDEAKEAAATLERLISLSHPTIPITKVRGNVVGLDGKAYRFM